MLIILGGGGRGRVHAQLQLITTLTTFLSANFAPFGGSQYFLTHFSTNTTKKKKKINCSNGVKMKSQTLTVRVFSYD